MLENCNRHCDYCRFLKPKVQFFFGFLTKKIINIKLISPKESSQIMNSNEE